MLQLRGSERLRQVLTAALAAGNALNTGTSHGGAQGFTIATLLKLANLRVSCLSFNFAGINCTRCTFPSNDLAQADNQR